MLPLLRSGVLFAAMVAFFNLSEAAELNASVKSVPGTPAPLSSALLVPATLEQSGATIGKIEVINDNIFDLDAPGENRVLHRWANALHVITKPEVITSQLLFQPGDHYDEQAVKETERLLRSNRYLGEAEITPSTYKDGVVDLVVHTSDVWTFTPSVSLSRSGGANSGGIGIKDSNLLGRGKGIGVSYKSTVDRDTLSLQYLDRNVMSSRYQMIAEYSAASDGYRQHFGFEQPFFALDTKRAGGANFSSGRSTESLYANGEISAEFEYSFAKHDIYLGWSDGLKDGWTRRLFSGVGLESGEYGAATDSLYPQPDIPDDRRFVYPFVGVEYLQDDYVTTRNFDQMSRTEDRHMGWRASFQLGYASPGFGSSSQAWLFKSDVADTVYNSQKSTVAVAAGLEGRIENGEARNTRLSVSGRFDKRQSENRLLHIGLTASVGKNLDLENTTYLGGDSGLRGYPLRYQGGDSALVFTIEQRIFTDWNPFHLFNVGGAVFFDAGRTWGVDPVEAERFGWLRDVGLGLRIGSTRSGLGRMIHLDLAYPLDGGSDISNLQFLVGTRTGF
jgi:outer membrane protein assembly factor BamA